MSPFKDNLEAAIARAESAEKEIKKLKKEATELKNSTTPKRGIDWFSLFLAILNIFCCISTTALIIRNPNHFMPGVLIFFLNLASAILCANGIIKKTPTSS